MATEPAIKVLREEFRTLSTLLTLITALNHDGPATLNLKSEEPLESPNSPETIMLNAITAYMVRRDEIVAAVFASPTNTVFTQAPQTSIVLSTTYLSEEEELEPDFRGLDSGAIATVANPRGSHKYNFPDDAECIVVPEGKSHWPKLMKDQWHGLTIP
jgi:hypothetical protein